MQEPDEEANIVEIRRSPSWPTAFAMLLAIVLLFVTFFWVFTQLEPVLGDVVERTTFTPTLTTTDNPGSPP